MLEEVVSSFFFGISHLGSALIIFNLLAPRMSPETTGATTIPAEFTHHDKHNSFCDRNHSGDVGWCWGLYVRVTPSLEGPGV